MYILLVLEMLKVKTTPGTLCMYVLRIRRKKKEIRSLMSAHKIEPVWLKDTKRLSKQWPPITHECKRVTD